MTHSQKYARRYLNNRNDYIDNSYRDESYNFDLPNDNKKKKNGKNCEEEEENGDNHEIRKKGQNNQELPAALVKKEL